MFKMTMMALFTFDPWTDGPALHASRFLVEFLMSGIFIVLFVIVPLVFEVTVELPDMVMLELVEFIAIVMLELVEFIDILSVEFIDILSVEFIDILSVEFIDMFSVEFDISIFSISSVEFDFIIFSLPSIVSLSDSILLLGIIVVSISFSVVVDSFDILLSLDAIIDEVECPTASDISGMSSLESAIFFDEFPFPVVDSVVTFEEVAFIRCIVEFASAIFSVTVVELSADFSEI